MQQKQKQKHEMLDALHKNPSNWRGVFYVNRRDPRIIVPKINPSLGWTLNFGNIYAYIAMVTIVVIIVVFQFL